MSATILAFVCLLRGLTFSAGADAVLDAKRKAASQLLKDSKPADAVTLFNEILTTDPSFYGDHLQLAKALEKLSRKDDAVSQYKIVLELVPPSASGLDERQARQEADKKIKLLDPLGGKIDAAMDDIHKKLDALERDASALRSMSGMERLFRVRAAIWKAEKVRDRLGFEVIAGLDSWQSTGIEVKERQVYRVRAAGTWRIRGDNDNDPLIECTAAGTKARKENTVGAPFLTGQLIGRVRGKNDVWKDFPLGEDAVFTAPMNGVLELVEFDHHPRTPNKGSILVLISLQ